MSNNHNQNHELLTSNHYHWEITNFKEIKAIFKTGKANFHSWVPE